MGSDDDLWLLSGSSGYGFVTSLESLQSRNKAGKVVVTLPSDTHLLAPMKVADYDTDLLAAVSAAGHLLVFPVAELPRLNRGKGNRIMSFGRGGQDHMSAVASVPRASGLVLYCGRRCLKLRVSELELYYGVRGRRGRMLPRGFRRVDSMEPAKGR
jgi:topoisomerase-4 subunit A